ncbi:porphobilinogen synthase [Petroclostridium sp. X23]|uniref:porphobilinogen synthase n=1 Tax=Petroclostridium sp. X23 TaxID=3045146 RepID=UPI0024AC8BAE|nr:porphobilinogen synthase [Petroclostridium sp. X23]WHH61577.1 porphobilinogen synthase [Petroclostridium sp. X23]
MPKRPRRLRANQNIRSLVKETVLTGDDFIYPLFVVEGEGVKKEISSLPGCYHLSLDMLHDEIEELCSLGIRAVLLFGIPDQKDKIGSGAFAEDGIVQKAVRCIKKMNKDILVVTDVCLCEYTSHGHCGRIKNGDVDNDSTLDLIAQTALSHVQAGADMVAPSDMMDGRVAAIRKILDKNKFTNTAIMAYSAKYASAFYGPFREAASSTPQFGDRKTYQMDPANKLEALKEVELDIEEGADIVMVKPALSYLDIINEVKRGCKIPVAAYNVSGEYAMLKAAAKMGWLDEKKAALEMLTSIKRAGADMIITYYAKDVARWMKEDGMYAI